MDIPCAGIPRPPSSFPVSMTLPNTLQPGGRGRPACLATWHSSQTHTVCDPHIPGLLKRQAGGPLPGMRQLATVYLLEANFHLGKSHSSATHTHTHTHTQPLVTHSFLSGSVPAALGPSQQTLPGKRTKALLEEQPLGPFLPLGP
jgi:hypothetical protein